MHLLNQVEYSIILTLSEYTGRISCSSNREPRDYTGLKTEGGGFVLCFNSRDKGLASRWDVLCRCGAVRRNCPTHQALRKACRQCLCLDRKRPDTSQKIKERIRYIDEEEGYSFVEYRDKGRHHDKYVIRCETHGLFEMSFLNFKAGHRCKKCCSGGRTRTNLPTCFYILSLTKDGVLVGYKFGITSKQISERLVRLKSSASEGVTITPIYNLCFKDSENALLLESYIKKVTRRLENSSDLIGTGYTETTPTSELEIIKRSITKYLKEI